MMETPEIGSLSNQSSPEIGEDLSHTAYETGVRLIAFPSINLAQVAHILFHTRQGPLDVFGRVGK